LITGAYAGNNFISNLKKACDKGDIKICGTIGVLYELSKGVKQDYFKAKEYYSKACDGGDED